MNNHTFYVRSARTRWLIGVGAVLLALGLPVVLIGGPGALLGAAVPFLILGCWQAANPILRLHADHLEMKVAPLAARRRIPYRDILEVEEGPRHTLLRVRTGGRVGKVRLPLTLLEPIQAACVLARLHSPELVG